MTKPFRSTTAREDSTPKAPGIATINNKLVTISKKRTRTGCQNCRRKRRKCDETKPTCENCQARQESCQWGIKLTFRPENAQYMSDEHPSMRQASGITSGGDFKIVDVTSEVVRDYFEESGPLGSGKPVPGARCGAVEEAARLEGMLGHDLDGGEAGRSGSNGLVGAEPRSKSHALPDPPDSTLACAQDFSHATNLTPLTTPSAFYANTASFPTMPSGLTPLSTPSRLDSNGSSFLSPQYSDPTLEDGIFIPGSQYQELHTRLRTRLIDTARSTVPSRTGSPRPNTPDVDLIPLSNSIQDDLDDIQWRSLAHLSPEQELLLLENYIDEVAPWLDKFDLNRHMELRIPPMAKSHPHLRYSILALSARQIERKQQRKGYSCSFALYAHAIHLLSPVLHHRSNAVLASCVVLAVLEMMSCSPRAWRRHLDGCAALIQALGISGASGDLEQALFWIFARMDVVGGLVSSETTLIPMHNWMCGSDIFHDLALFGTDVSADTYANEMEYLCGRTIELLCSSGKWDQKHSKRSSQRMNLAMNVQDYARAWSQLFELVETWYEARPENMKALLSIPSLASQNLEDGDEGKGNTNPFPTLYFGNGPATSGNQIYHTTALLLLKHAPTISNPPSGHSTILHHARHICAISISNSHHGSWTNSTQPLWLAGQELRLRGEREAVLGILERIERESGWASRWRGKDLRTFWSREGEGEGGL
ncbi:hypothetical protein LTR62_003006 [Meristemomyces frigidus]|uniref:Zn(2)-C6 fungal-type domain-containing protein n=1 Tax=Meristemomyces frigidus TaxID=1508187 RepID=A0AAN7YNJ3_9PEZI|nr:hypothetical protein LTR62_003006 [Meristemomyces frigidus]